MLTFLRRFLVVSALLFWQGGFLFYSSVVVPIGQKVLPTKQDQGFITRQVTKSMNWAGAVALVPLLWDCAVPGDPNTWRRRLRWLMWLILAITLAALFWLHPHLDVFLDPDPKVFVVYQRGDFRFWHRIYLWVSTVNWGAGVVYIALMLLSWRSEDRTAEAVHA
jgi:hypothetical protein